MRQVSDPVVRRALISFFTMEEVVGLAASVRPARIYAVVITFGLPLL